MTNPTTLEVKAFLSACIDRNINITNKDIVKTKLGIYVQHAEKPHWFITIA